MSTITITYAGKQGNSFTAEELKTNIATHDAKLDLAKAVGGSQLLDYIRTKMIKQPFSAKLLAGKCTITMQPGNITDKDTGDHEVVLKVKNGNKVEEAGKLKVHILADPAEWPDNVICAKDKMSVPQPYRKKIVEIAANGGSGSHGYVQTTNHVQCLHWTAGQTERVFGHFGSGKLTVVGWGTHNNTSSDYEVTLASGKVVKASTVSKS